MKKIFITILFFLSMLFCTSSILSADNVTRNEGGTLLSSFPTAYIPPERTEGGLSDDTYEINDSYKKSVFLCPSNYNNLEMYHASLNAKLEANYGYLSYDYYHFNLLEESYVVVILESDRNDYFCDLIIQKINYVSGDDGISTSTVDLVCNINNEEYKSYSATLTGGTYYIIARNKQGSNCNVDINYSLDLYVEKTPDTQNASISNMRDTKKLMGAIWISDFVPEGRVSISDLNSVDLQYKGQSVTSIDYAVDDVLNMSNGNPILIGDVYIWDKLLKFALHNIFYVLRNSIHDEFVQESKLAMELELQKNTTTNAIEIIGTIAGKSVTIPIISTSIEILSAISIHCLNEYFDMLIPKFTIDKIEYLTFLANYAAYFDIGVPRTETSMANIINAQDNKVVRLPIYYSTSSNSNEKFNYKVTFSKMFEINSVYYDDIININQQDSQYSRGKIYAIRNAEDINNLNNLFLVEDILSHYHDYKIYEWLDNSRHTAYCNCGSSTIQGHAVLSGTNTCVVCGGYAEMGFIGGNSISYYVSANGSYILPNGVIVLVENDLHSYLNGTLRFYKNNNFSDK